MVKRFRINGAVGALLDEYEKAIEELKFVIQALSNDELSQIVDNKTKDEDCRSIQTILTHVVSAGYTYVVEIRKWCGETIDYRDKVSLTTAKEYQTALDMMFAYNESLFEDYPKLKLEEMDNSKKMKVRWGQQYDVEQLIEHAIVHVLRHRRQIEKLKLRLQ